MAKSAAYIDSMVGNKQKRYEYKHANDEYRKFCVLYIHYINSSVGN